VDLFKIKYRGLRFWTMVLCAGLLLTGTETALAKADRYFVDYDNNTGYYVDVNSIELPSEHEVLCDLYLVKLHGGYMYRYRAYFDTQEGSYEYQNVRVYDYETKKLVSAMDFLQPRQSYHKSSMLKQTVSFALEWKRTHLHKTPYGESWE